jgi:hypothetical protein
MSIERRTWPRVEILGELSGRTFTLDEPITIRDTSLGGLSVEMQCPLQVGSRHDFQLTDGERSVVVSARVSHMRVGFVGDETRYYCGVQFVDLTDDARAFLSDCLTTSAVIAP